MQVKVSFFGPIRRPWPEASRELELADGTGVEGLLVSLGYQAEDLQRVAVVINGQRRKLDARIEPGDDVRLVLLAGGG